MILSLAILGLGCGGIFAFYKFKNLELKNTRKIFSFILFLFGISILIFILTIVTFTITNSVIYFILLFIPFFLGGIFYAEVFRIYAKSGFAIYAADLTGAAIGAVCSIIIINILGGNNSLILLTVIALASALSMIISNLKKLTVRFSSLVLLFVTIFILIKGNENIIGRIPVGHYPEKDIYYAYSDPTVRSKIIESRWSIYGRTDLVEYSHQDVVKHLFIDGAAGSPMYRFNGNPQNISPVLYNMIIRSSNTTPFFLLNEYEKNKMLVIGPGGGREVLTGLLSGIDEIDGVEINPDFVDIVQKYRDYNGGIYTDFPNVNIFVQEGRHFIKKTDKKYDLIVMSLPSTEQLQNIDNFAMSENFLLTVEAIRDYLKILTPEGQLFFTLHNDWELMRLIISTIKAFESEGIGQKQALNHFIIIDDQNIPTIIIKKQAYLKPDITFIQNIIKTLPPELPEITYLPWQNNNLKTTKVNSLLLKLKTDNMSIKRYIDNYKFDIAPCYDDSPYFYKIIKGVPQDFLWLLLGVSLFNFVLLTQPLIRIRKRENTEKFKKVLNALIIFSCIGTGFMIIEISLFQKLILYLGSPTISLSVLLSALLIGMGAGSYFSRQIYRDNPFKRIIFAAFIIIILGILLFTILPLLLNELLIYSMIIRVMVSILLIIPLGFFLGIPFPSGLQIMHQGGIGIYIPWMYGINGTMTVLGSVLAVIISMLRGFTPSFFIGLSFYILILLLFHIFSGEN